MQLVRLHLRLVIGPGLLVCGRVRRNAARALTGLGSAFAGLAAAGATFSPGQPAAVAEATLETGLTRPGLVGPGGFGLVRVNGVPGGCSSYSGRLSFLSF